MSFANMLPRRASPTAFLSFVVAHLLCPLIWTRALQGLPHNRDEQCMPTRVASQLWMERRGQQRPLTHRDDSIGRTGEHIDLGAAVLHPRRPNEDAVHRRFTCDTGKVDVAFP